MHLVVPRTCLILHQSNHNSNVMMTQSCSYGDGHLSDHIPGLKTTA